MRDRAELSTSGGTSDARFMKDHCPVVEFGLVGQSMHQVDEFAEIDHIEQLKRVYSRVLAGLFRLMLDVGLTDDLATCHALRRVVFIEEQNVDPALEVDGRDGTRCTCWRGWMACRWAARAC